MPSTFEQNLEKCLQVPTIPQALCKEKMEDFLNFFFLNPFPSHYMREDGGPEINVWAAARRSRSRRGGGWDRKVTLPIPSFPARVFGRNFLFSLFFSAFQQELSGEKGVRPPLPPPPLLHKFH